MVRVQRPAALLSGVLGRDTPEGSRCDYSGDMGTARCHLPEREGRDGPGADSLDHLVEKITCRRILCHSADDGWDSAECPRLRRRNLNQDPVALATLFLQLHTSDNQRLTHSQAFIVSSLSPTHRCPIHFSPARAQHAARPTEGSGSIFTQ